MFTVSFNIKSLFYVFFAVLVFKINYLWDLKVGEKKNMVTLISLLGYCIGMGLSSQN